MTNPHSGTAPESSAHTRDPLGSGQFHPQGGRDYDFERAYAEDPGPVSTAGLPMSASDYLDEISGEGPRANDEPSIRYPAHSL